MLKQRKCPVCGKVFYPRNTNQKYCCGDCSRMAKRNRQNGYKTKKCPVCGRVFPAKNDQHKYCCYECRREAKIERAIKEKTESKKKKCPVCGRFFELMTQEQEFCCQWCEMRAKKYAKEKDVQQEHPQRLCHDCKKVRTPNYRCPACLKEWQRKHGVTASADNFAHAVYDTAAC